MDAVGGLTYMQQRYYDPAVGVFLSVDPVTAHDNPIGAFNRYWYGADNPYKFVDPDGRVVRLSGDTDDQTEFIRLASELTGLRITQHKNGTLSATGKIENGAAIAFMRAINSKSTIDMRVVNNDRNVTFDDASGVIDRGDFAAASSASKQLGQAILAHTFTEQVALMNMGGRTRSNYNNGAHSAGFQAEMSAMGASMRTSNKFTREFLNSIGLKINYKITYEFTHGGSEVYSLPLD
ncbi:MAG: RHS repeat-associated core domain-containing protein [Thermomonas sp.]|uniref:RHS repeat-associated core domain-containing protein n=1 Tax=Thermomonas sp. TaxID=1971895 RepID=UPI00260C6B26|nr:RHS repeat-associated core domain-containing protein [Thermomonas sp.]MCC7096206.1 RHS repeat-associated core domain-containing protein [Thermomonas sp.]